MLCSFTLEGRRDEVEYVTPFGARAREKDRISCVYFLLIIALPPYLIIELAANSSMAWNMTQKRSCDIR